LGSLRRVTFWESGINVDAFLDTHGPKLTELSLSHSNLRTSKDKIIEVCSNLRSMTIKSLPYNRVGPNNLSVSWFSPSLG
jgi:Leucine-rich repeat (LRR) protein